MYYGWIIVFAGLLMISCNGAIFIYGFTAFIEPIALSFVIASLMLLTTSLSTAKTIRVKVVVDEEEGMANGKWQQRLQRRVERASQVINAFCDLKFGVVACIFRERKELWR